jgi:hypothetical protein
VDRDVVGNDGKSVGGGIYQGRSHPAGMNLGDITYPRMRTLLVQGISEDGQSQYATYQQVEHHLHVLGVSPQSFRDLTGAFHFQCVSFGESENTAKAIQPAIVVGWRNRA